MTVDELVDEMEGRRGAKRFVWVAPRLKLEERGSLRLESVCTCHGCTHAWCYDFSSDYLKVSRETGEAA